MSTAACFDAHKIESERGRDIEANLAVLCDGQTMWEYFAILGYLRSSGIDLRRFFSKDFCWAQRLNRPTTTGSRERGAAPPRLHKRKERLGCLLLALLDENFNATEIHEAKRKAVLTVLLAPSSKARNERGALRVSKFKSVGKLSFSLAERLAL
jgi:hypothetical protein